jgi:double-stranded uracil-DNA glycosylase
MRTRIVSLPAIASPDATVLVLGTMLGKQSLTAGEYYAHPRNAFWRIMGAMFDFDPSAPYAARVRRLKEERVAVWDVLESCVRGTSLDRDIEREVANKFAPFFRRHSKIERVCFNGAAAEKLFWKHACATRDAHDYVRLPSSSPAHAVAFDTKLAAWRKALALRELDAAS